MPNTVIYITFILAVTGLADAAYLRRQPVVALQMQSKASTQMDNDSVLQIAKEIADDDVTVSIAVSSDGTQYIITEAGNIYSGSGEDWKKLPGSAIDIAAGADGSLWAIGSTRIHRTGGNAILKWNGQDWEKVDGAASRIAVGPNGLPWVVNEAGIIYERKSDNTWHQHPGRAIDIGVGTDSSVWVIGASRVGSGGNGIFEWTGKHWRRIDGAAMKVTVGPTGKPWVVNEAGNVYQRTEENTWKLIRGGASDIGAGGSLNNLFVYAAKKASE